MNSNCKMIECYPSDKSIDVRELCSKKNNPWLVPQQVQQYTVLLEFKPTNVRYYQLKNYFSSTIRIRFMFDGNLRYSFTLCFNSDQNQAFRVEDLNIDGECNQVELTFLKEKNQLKQKTGVMYFLIFDQKVVGSAQKQYSNLSEKQILGSNNKSTPNYNLNQKSSYYSVSARTNILKDRKPEQFRRSPLQTHKIQKQLTLKEINQKIQRLTDRSNDDQQAFKIQWDRLLQLKQQAEIREITKKQSKIKEKQQKSKASLSIQGQKRIEEDSLQTVVIPDSDDDQQRYKLKVLNHQVKQFMQQLNHKGKDRQIMIQNRLGIPEKYRLSNYIIFTISGYVGQQRAKLKQIGTELGLVYTNQIADNCILIASGASNPKVKEIKRLKGCVVVSKEYLVECRKYNAQMCPKDYALS